MFKEVSVASIDQRVIAREIIQLPPNHENENES